MDNSLLVETTRLTKRFGERTAVDSVDLAIPHGVAYGLLGPNGAGKTTLMRTLLGLTKATSGTAVVDGRPIPQERAAALARVGAVIEEPRFHDHLTGRENLRIVSALLSDECTARISSALQRVGLAQRADDRVRTYSQGMRQRLGIARCLLNDPILLILDEPMNGLDPAGIQEMRVLIRGFVAEKRTVLISSHLLDEVEKTCDIIAILDRGRLIRQGSIAQLNEQPIHQVAVTCDDTDAARTLASKLAAVTNVESRADGALLFTLTSDDVAAELNRVLVTGGVAVTRLEPVHVSLEERFLDITARLDDNGEKTR